jgi:hypothetical protein
MPTCASQSGHCMPDSVPVYQRMGGLTRHRRAKMFHSRTPAFWQSVVISCIPTTLLAGWLALFGSDNDTVNDIIIPAAIAIVSFITILMVTWGYEYVRLVWTGRAPTASKRTMKHLNTSRLEQVLSANVEFGMSIWLRENTVEIADFADEMEALLVKSGWDTGGGRGYSIGSDARDLVIWLSEKGNPGLEALGEFIRKAGYKVNIEEGGGTSPSMEVGDATH